MKLGRYTRTISAAWGVGGVMLLVVFAIYRLVPFALGIAVVSVAWWQWAIFVAWAIYMVYSEGYMAFYKLFAPRVMARAQYLLSAPHVSLTRRLLAPAFCMAYFGAPKRRIITAYSLTLGIIVLIVVVHFVPQPWRGIIDGGVVLGLISGLVALVLRAVRVFGLLDTQQVDAEVM